jgi:hypothetical protein
MKKLFTLMCILFISSCSTTQVNISESIPVPEKNIHEHDYLINKEGYEAVTFVRDAGLMGSGCSGILYINNNKAFTINSKQSITVYLKPGNHFFRLEKGTDNSLCPNEIMSQSTSLTLGEPQTYRISTSSNYNDGFARIK